MSNTELGKRGLRLNRRRFLRTILAAGGALLLHPFSVAPAQATGEPPFYIPQTGHHLSGQFLDYSRTHQNGLLIGAPITEELLDAEGRRFQLFENALLEEHPELAGTPQAVQPVALGRFYAENLEHFQPDADLGINPEFYNKYGGLETFGQALTPKIPITDGVVQFFDRFALKELDLVSVRDSLERSYNLYLLEKSKFPRLIWPGEVQPLPLGRSVAELYGTPTTPVNPLPNAIRYTPNYWDRQKEIEVNLTRQLLFASEGDTTIMQTSVSTGSAGFETVRGSFKVLGKQDALDYVSPFGNQRNYLQLQVPFNLRFHNGSLGGYFLHGAYWHQEFGRQKSAGCVNLNLDDASFLYDWARPGTPVLIREAAKSN